MKSVLLWKRTIEYYMMLAFCKWKSDLDTIFDDILKLYRDKYITPSDTKLLNLFFKKDVTQDDLDNFLEVWDIEKEGGHKALMLSYFMKLHPEFTYSSYIEPRLNGILKYYRFKNLSLVSHYKKICTAIKQAGIEFLVLKGGALKYYNPEFPRIMGDIDILVPPKDYEKAKKIALSFGYKYTEHEHSIDLQDPQTDLTLLDIHYKFNMHTATDDSITEDIFKRAKRENVFGIDGVYVPCVEDMLFLLLVNLNKNMAQYSSFPSILYSIIDSKYLINLKPDFDWDIVKQNAVKTQTEHHLAVAIRFINEYASDKLPEMYEKEFNERCILHIYNEWYLKKLQKKSHTLFIDTVKRIIKNIIKYFKFRYLYIIHRQKSVRTDVNRAKSILETQDLIKR